MRCTVGFGLATKTVSHMGEQGGGEEAEDVSKEKEEKIPNSWQKLHNGPSENTSHKSKTSSSFLT